LGNYENSQKYCKIRKIERKELEKYIELGKSREFGGEKRA